MNIAYPSDLDDSAWLAHDAALNRCRGALCVDSISRFFAARDCRTYKMKDIEALAGFAGRSGHREDANGALRKWEKGSKLTSTSIATVYRNTGRFLDLRRIVDHPLWELMRKLPPDWGRLNRILEDRSDDVREILCLEPDRAGQFSHHVPRRQTKLALRDLGGLDAFTAMLCLARRGEWQEHPPSHALPSMCAFDMFPRLLVSEPMLVPHWRAIADCLQRVFWSRRYPQGLTIDLPMARLVRNVERLQANPLANFKYISGRRLSLRQELRSRREQVQWDMERAKRERASRRRLRALEDRLDAAFESPLGSIESHD